MTSPVRERTRRELAQEAKRRALAQATRSSYLRRLGQWDRLRREGRLQPLRDWARDAKDRVLSDHRRHLEQFVRAVRERGGFVHVAATPEEAVARVVAIARRHGARLAVKSKSMATEEIHLNAGLEAAGVEVVETDLGEYIIQLAGERPVHIVGPSIHYDREAVARLFSRHLGEPMPPDPEALTQVARRVLREKFLAAEIGITGANFGVAETGTVVLVTNEGNGRMVTTLPRVLITIMGLEKLVGTWADLEPLLTLLPRSATGQTLTSYVTAITGPRRPGEADGPEEFHVVILDAGRSRLLGTPFQPALRCLRCGACLDACPVFRQVGGHAYLPPYSGPIGVVITPLLKGMEAAGEVLDLCSLCGACTEACPVQIPLHRFILDLRHQRMASPRASRWERLLFRFWAWAWRTPGRYRWTVRLLRALARPFVRDGRLRWLPGPLAAWGEGRDFPAPAARPFHERWADLAREAEPERNTGEVADGGRR
ncbi:MAG: LutB/LldF family L-lactate oxidation iron-sulfur protein [Firmicutes bacterium]|nr:LutB/LldF family L-lactate oxidation iron-sulfur protein [Bacillota bacterium]